MSPTTFIPFILAGSALGQTVVQGPVTFAGNWHRYRLLQASSWEQARQWARDHGGELATIRSSLENQFLYAQFGANGRKYLIGLADVDHPGTLEWSDGSSSLWRAWAPGEPTTRDPGRRYTIVQTDQLWYTRGTNYAPYYLIEHSGPLTVPEEFPTLADAVRALPMSGASEIIVGPGIHPTGGDLTAVPPPNVRGRIVGVGREATQVQLGGSQSGLTLEGDWTVEDLSFTRVGVGPMLAVPGGSCELTRVGVQGYFFNGDPAIIVNGGGLLTARGCRFSDSVTLFGHGGTPGHVDLQTCFLTDIGVVTASEVSGSFRACTMAGIGIIFQTAFEGRAALTNSIVWPRTGMLGTSALTAHGCDIQDLWPLHLSPDNIDANPRFVSSADLSLQEGSPCIDAGSLADMAGGLDYDGHPRLSGSAPDIGAYEHQAPECPVDFNGDGFVDFFDYDDFVAAFEGGC